MKTILGIFGIFLATVLFLSIEIGNRPIFGHIYKVISPATKYTQKGVENLFGAGVDSTQRYSKKLFENSVPKVGDSVRSKMSATKKKNAAAPLDDISKEDKQELDALIKSQN